MGILDAFFVQTSLLFLGTFSLRYTDEAVATAMLDRLLHHSHTLSLQADSYRMKERLKVGAVGFE